VIILTSSFYCYSLSKGRAGEAREPSNKGMLSAPTYKVKSWLLKGISVGKYSTVVYSTNKADAREREREREGVKKEGQTNKQTQKKQTTKK